MSESEDIKLVPIGVIRSPFKTPEEAPRQGRGEGEVSVLEVFPQFVLGLRDIEKATHLIVLYWCHMARRDVLVTKTPYGPEERGVFACRSPSRPNPIAFCVADVVRVEGNRVIVKGLDAVDGSPLLDVKPYSAILDCVSEARIGWLEAKVYKEVDSDAQDRRQRPRGQRQEHRGGAARPDAGPREQGVGGGRG